VVVRRRLGGLDAAALIDDTSTMTVPGRISDSMSRVTIRAPWRHDQDGPDQRSV